MKFYTIWEQKITRKSSFELL